MFEEIVEKKFKPLKDITDGLKVISPDTIKNSDLPTFAINFLLAEQTDINDKDSLNLMLEKSVKLIVNYSLRPKWTIINYLFGGYDSKPADEILKKSEVFRFYRYYIDLISNHIKDNALMFLAQEEVIYLINEANKVVLDKLVNNTSSVKIKNFFSQVYKLKYGDNKEINLDWSIPFLFIKLFLEDKEFFDLLDKFKIIPGLDDTMEIEMKTAIKVLTGKYYVNDDFFVLKDEPLPVKTESAKTENNKPLPENIIEKNIEEEKAEQKQIEIDLKEEIKTVEEKKVVQKTQEIIPEKDDKPKGIVRIIKNIPSKKFHRNKKIVKEEIKPITEEKLIEEKFEEPTVTEEVLKKRERTDSKEKIKHIFKGEEIKIIQKKIFKDSKSAMHEAFNTLEGFDSWNNASEFLKELFSKNNVRLYSKYTVLFVDLLSDYFSKIEKGK